MTIRFRQRRSPSAGPRRSPSTYRVVGRQYKGPPSAPPRYEPPPQLAPDARTSFHQPPPNANGDAIELQQGETLYGISRRTGVPVAAIKDANGLSSDAVHPGQRLVMPTGAQDGLRPILRLAPDPWSGDPHRAEAEPVDGPEVFDIDGAAAGGERLRHGGDNRVDGQPIPLAGRSRPGASPPAAGSRHPGRRLRQAAAATPRARSSGPGRPG